MHQVVSLELVVSLPKGGRRHFQVPLVELGKQVLRGDGLLLRSLNREHEEPLVHQGARRAGDCHKGFRSLAMYTVIVLRKVLLVDVLTPRELAPRALPRHHGRVSAAPTALERQGASMQVSRLRQVESELPQQLIDSILHPFVQKANDIHADGRYGDLQRLGFATYGARRWRWCGHLVDFHHVDAPLHRHPASSSHAS